nr:MAG TPA: hypothetical protein [Caudoviricetes sp.]
MKREEAKKMLPILVAFAEGKAIESRCIKGDTSLWYDDEDPSFDDDFEYRIKPDSKSKSKTDANYRPFANVEECWQELLKHEPFGWVKDTEANEYLNVYCISNSASSIDIFGRMFKRCIFIDGSPYGIKVEE